MRSSTLLLGIGAGLSTLFSIARATSYVVEDTYAGSTFFDNFDFVTVDDRNGFVTYFDRIAATNARLVKQVGSDAYMGVDFQTPMIVQGGRGRSSVRIQSKKRYNHGLFILDIKHMPTACGTWPAFWSLGEGSGSVNGEIDIISGVNRNINNQLALHTDTQCKTDGVGQTGLQSVNNCALDSTSGPIGCRVDALAPNTYSDGFNANGGGAYVMEWTSEAIKIWFFPRGSIPASITADKPNTSDFGSPLANFQGDCNIDNRFKDHHFVFATNFCGDLAGNTYDQSGCPRYAGLNGMDSCRKFVAENPTAFRNSYWQLSHFKTYRTPAVSSSSSAMPSTSSSMVASTSSSEIASISTSDIASISSSVVSSTLSDSSTFPSSVEPTRTASSSTVSTLASESSALPASTLIASTTPSSSTTLTSASESIIPLSSTTAMSISSSSSIPVASESSSFVSSTAGISTSASSSSVPASQGSILSTSTAPSLSGTSLSQTTSSRSSNSPPSTIQTLSGASSTPGLKISPDATCGGNTGYTCRGSKFGDCCSQYGWCGSKDMYCGIGCQSSFGLCKVFLSSFSTRTLSTSAKLPVAPSPTARISTDARCGGNAKTTCQGSIYGNCCSQYGWCGSTSDYCKVGCNPLFGSCKK